MSTVTNFTWNNGTADLPVPLTSEMIDKLIAKKDELDPIDSNSGERLTNNMQVSGYYKGDNLTGDVSSSRLRMMEERFPDLEFNGREVSDNYSVSCQQSIEEGNEYIINVSRKEGDDGVINENYLTYLFEFNDNDIIIYGNPNNFTKTNIKNKFSIINKDSKKQLKVSEPTENISWVITFRIKTCIIGDEDNPNVEYVYSNFITCTSKALDSITLIPTTNKMLTQSTQSVTISYEPNHSTKIPFVTTTITINPSSLASYNENNNRITSNNIVGTFKLNCDYSFKWGSGPYQCEEKEISILQITKMTINQTNDIPTITITPSSNNFFTNIINDIHLYVGKYIKDANNIGKMYIKQLSDNNKAIYDDEIETAVQYRKAPSDITGGGIVKGDVFWKCPTFYYKGVNTIEDGVDKVDIYFSSVKPNDSTYKIWNTNNLIGVYQASETNGGLYSHSGKTPISADSIEHDINYIKTCLANRNIEGLSLISYQAHVVLALLFYGIYNSGDYVGQNNVNCQSIIGSGRIYNDNADRLLYTTGHSNNLGITDSDTQSSSNCINFLGLENWWGGLRELFADVGGGVSTNDVNYLYADDRTIANFPTNEDNNEKYITKFIFGEYVDLIPKEYKGNSNTNNGFCDYGRTTSFQSPNALRGPNIANDALSERFGITAITFGIPSVYPIPNSPASINLSWRIGARIMYKGSSSNVEDITHGYFDDI